MGLRSGGNLTFFQRCRHLDNIFIVAEELGTKALGLYPGELHPGHHDPGTPRFHFFPTILSEWVSESLSDNISWLNPLQIYPPTTLAGSGGTAQDFLLRKRKKKLAFCPLSAPSSELQRVPAKRAFSPTPLMLTGVVLAHKMGN